MTVLLKFIGGGFVINVILAFLGIEAYSFYWWIGVGISATILGILDSVWAWYYENN